MPDTDQIIPAHKNFDKGDFFWLVYLVFFLIEPFARHSLPYWIECLAAIALFVALYMLFLRCCSPRSRVACLGGMFVLGLATYPHNGGGTCFMIYAGAMLPFITGSLPWILTGLLTESVLLAAEGAWFHISPYSWFSSILLILSIGGSNIFFAQKGRADHKLRMKQEEIESLAAVAERERIARDLHDVLGHTLSVIVLKSELANRLLARELAALSHASSQLDAPSSFRHSETETPGERLQPTGSNGIARPPLLPDPGILQRAQTEIADVERTARTALAEVREAIGGYRARGLLAEIDAARSTLASAGVSLHTEGELRPAPLGAAEETVLALALREAITNIVRHSHATSCTLRLAVEDGRHLLSIKDNGQHAGLREGNGLRGMRERVEALGGHLSLTRDTGTHLTIALPLRAG